MQLLTVPTQEQDEAEVQAHLVQALEHALEIAKAGDMTSVVVVYLDGRGEEDSIGVVSATDSWIQTAGMLVAAQREI